MAYITIVKGDDTDFLDNQYLVINFNTEFDLTGFQAIFKLGNFELVYPDLSAKYIEIVLSKDVTSSLQKGKLYGTLQIVDTELRKRTITTVIPFNVVTKVSNASQISKQSIQLDVRIEQNEFNVDMNILGLSKVVAENYLSQMKQYDAKNTDRQHSMKILEANVEKMAADVEKNLEETIAWTTSESSIDGVNQSAKTYSKNSEEYSIEAKAWANKLDDTVDGKEYSAKYYSEKAKEFLNNTLDKSMISNCLLEVPQNIKLELVNGVLTLKAGSRVIVPNGFEADGVTPKFDYLTTTEDLSLNTTYNDTRTWVINSTLKGYEALPTYTCCFSGSTAPTSIQWMLWYDTETNKIKTTSDYGATWIESFSLPVCIFSGTNVPTRIDETFNGMGYVGSTIWIDKGVKGLIPDGRNDDGTLKNMEFTTDKILMQTQPNATANIDLYLSKTGVFRSTTIYYNEKLNFNISSVNGTNESVVLMGNCTLTSGVISNFNPKNPFKVLNPAGDTMTGRLNIIAPRGTHLSLQSQIQDINVTPTENMHDNYLDFIDKNGVLIGRIYNEKLTDGRVELGFQTWYNGSCTGLYLYRDANGRASYYPYQMIDSWGSGHSGYCVWSNGYCEQWGLTGNNTNQTITLFKAYIDGNYNITSGTAIGTDKTKWQAETYVIDQWRFQYNSYDSCHKYWKTCGYLAAGQY